MKSYLLRLDDEDTRNRQYLEKHFQKKHGRHVPFADIVREMMKEKVSSFRQEP